MKGALRRALAAAPLTLVFVGLFVYPVARLLLMPWLPWLGPSGAEGLHGVATSLPVQAIVNTLRLGLASTMLAVPLGVLLGWWLERRLWAGRAALVVVLWLIFLTPSYLLTTGWQIVFSSTALHHGPLANLFFSQIGIVALLALKGLPFACLASRSSWRALGPEIIDAARLHIRSPAMRWGILIRLLLPAAGSAFAVVFIESIQEFGIPATLGAQIHLPIVTYAIYEQLATTPVDFTNAAWLSWALVIMALLAASVHLYLGGRYASALVDGRQRISVKGPCLPIERIAAAILLGFLAVFGVGIPGAAVIHAALETPDAAATSAIPVAWNSLLYSTLYAVIAALMATLLAMTLVARKRNGTGWIGQATELLSLANMAIPGLVLGAAYVIAFNVRWLPLYGTPLLLIIAYVAAQVPMLTRFLQAPMGQIHKNLADAARIHGLPLQARIADIHMPLLSPPFIWGWCMAFGQIFFELPVSELLYPANAAPVGVTVVSLNQSLRFADASRLALVGIVLSLAIAGLMALVMRLAVTPEAVKEAQA